MAAMRSRCGHYTFVVFFLSFFYFLPNLSGCRLDVYHTSTQCGPSANLECRSEMCCTPLIGNAGPKKSPKIRLLVTIAQLCQAISSQLRHVSTIRKKLVKQQCLPHMFSQYDELLMCVSVGGDCDDWCVCVSGWRL